MDRLQRWKISKTTTTTTSVTLRQRAETGKLRKAVQGALSVKLLKGYRPCRLDTKLSLSLSLTHSLSSACFVRFASRSWLHGLFDLRNFPATFSQFYAEKLAEGIERVSVSQSARFRAVSWRSIGGVGMWGCCFERSFRRVHEMIIETRVFTLLTLTSATFPELRHSLFFRTIESCF